MEVPRLFQLEAEREAGERKGNDDARETLRPAGWQSWEEPGIRGTPRGSLVRRQRSREWGDCPESLSFVGQSQSLTQFPLTAKHMSFLSLG
jgi:hypothetical protein